MIPFAAAAAFCLGIILGMMLPVRRHLLVLVMGFMLGYGLGNYPYYDHQDTSIFLAAILGVIFGGWEK